MVERLLVDWARAVLDGFNGTPTPEAAAAPKPSGPPEPTQKSKERLKAAQLAQQERLKEQAGRLERHRAEANYGMATSARPSLMPPPEPKPAAEKSSQPSGGDFVNLYRSLAEEYGL